MNFFKTRVILMEQLHIQPSEIDRMPYYEYEYSIDLYEEVLEERKQNQEKQTQSQKEQYGDPMKMGSSLMNKAKSGFRMPSMPKINIPKI
jgi:hypothetical protein